ncbi:unnamed protein product, partial [Adineta steineri]
NFLNTAEQHEGLFNRTTFGNLSTLMNTSFDFTDYLQRAYLLGNVTLNDTDIINIRELKVLRNISMIIKQNSSRIIQNYLIWRFIMNQISHMPKRFRVIQQQFYRIFIGTAIEKPRPIKCANYVNSNMGMVVSRLYIMKKFDEYSRRESMDMIKNIRDEFAKMINQSDWMDPSSKTVAIEKAQLVQQRVGYPDGLDSDNITNLEQKYASYIFNSSYMQNILTMLQINAQNNFYKLRKSVDRNDWAYAAPTDVNAYYDASFNDIIITAAILQAPLFSKDAPKYLNYGGIGAAIGHELTHGFDDIGRQFDKNGNRLPWWTNETINAFNGKKQCMIDQYNNYTVAQVNISISGEQTLGENIADNGGLKEAFLAYQNWARINPNMDKKLSGLTKYSAEQMFFMNFGLTWCAKLKDQAARIQTQIDVHAPNQFR